MHIVYKNHLYLQCFPPCFVFYVYFCSAEHVFALDATDDFLNKRAQGLPEKVAEKMRCTEEEFVPRLTKYRNYMAAEETVLDYFDELEIHPKHIGTVTKVTTILIQQTI